MNDIQAALFALLPPKRKTTPSGWISFDSVCCHHRGETRDDRMRGGVMSNAAGGFQYHCFNCMFKTGWSSGRLLSINTRQLFKWLGMNDSDISKLGLVALRLKENLPQTVKTLNFDLEEHQLPEDCQSIDNWIKEDCQEQDLLDVISYLVDQRAVDWLWYP